MIKGIRGDVERKKRRGVTLFKRQAKLNILNEGEREREINKVLNRES